jgi:hypothetical protein
MKLKDGKLVWELKEPFDIIVQYADHPIWLPDVAPSRTEYDFRAFAYA